MTRTKPDHETIDAGRVMKSRILRIVAASCALALLAGCVQPDVLPIAQFTRTPATGETPLFVSFDASSSRDNDGYIESWSWAFGDGSTGSGVTASHTYTNAGTYSATLTVRDDDGATHSVSHSISATSPPAPAPTPIPDFPSPSPPSSGVDYNVTVGQIVDEFSANEIAAILKYQNKTIAVSGYISNVSMSISDEPYVTLKRGPGFYFAGVFCDFPTSALSTLASLVEDEHITIVGEFDDFFLGAIWLDDCYLP